MYILHVNKVSSKADVNYKDVCLVENLTFNFNNINTRPNPLEQESAGLLYFSFRMYFKLERSTATSVNSAAPTTDNYQRAV
jgi:hypothetical protein